MIREGAGSADSASGRIFRYAVDFAVEGDVRFCSHRDTMRLFARAFARADLPVRFSEGFNPHPRFSLLPPRPLGVASQADRLVLELVQPHDADALLRRLSETMPIGITLLQARPLGPGETCQAIRAWYVVALPGVDPEALASRTSGLLASAPLFVERPNKKDGRPKRVDIHPFIESLSVSGSDLTMTLRISQEGTAKPSEVCAALGVTDKAVHSWTRRVKIEWQ